MLRGEQRRSAVLLLGGIGTGHVGIAADGTLRQWQLANTGNHVGDVPSLMAIRTSGIEPPHDETFLLRLASPAAAAEPAPGVTDHLVPRSVRTSGRLAPHAVGDEARAAYPFLTVPFAAPGGTLRGELSAFTPFVPLDDRASGLPLAVFDIELTSTSQHRQHGWVAFALLNMLGWDGVSLIDGAVNPGFAANLNTVERAASNTALRMTNGGADEVLLHTDAPCAALPAAVDEAAVLRWLDTLKLLRPTITGDWGEPALRAAASANDALLPAAPSPVGRSWLGALGAAFALAPGERTTLRFELAWRFPDRLGDFDQFGAHDADPRAAPARLGNAYATLWPSAAAAVADFRGHPEYEALSREWAQNLWSSDLPRPLIETLDAMPGYLRSPSVFRAEDGRWLGFEGVLGASTRNWNGDVGGSCPLNCTHVWNYDQTLGRLFPAAARSMSETELDVLLAPDGFIPHRLHIPADGPQLWHERIGGPDAPALDGMLGAVLKAYRYLRTSGDVDWIRARYGKLASVLGYVARTWDPERTGVLRGAQPVTYDISLTRANMFVGGLWLAALRCAEEIALILGDEPTARDWRGRFEQGSAAHVELLWNGEYFGQAGAGAQHDFGDGCLSDQLVGQCWAHQLGLGYLVPAGLVRTALGSIVAHNFRRDLRGFEHGYRVFADADDAGLLVCTWPRGNRPDTPIRYADEVWTGVEYQVAAHCLFEGMDDAGLLLVKAVRDRYDGTRRNPFNEIECGDHYVRAMAGWALLPGWTGLDFDARSGVLSVGREGRFPFVFGTGWGRAAVGRRGVRIELAAGTLDVSAVARDGTSTAGQWHVEAGHAVELELR